MPSVGHYHERDGNLRADCEGCVEERLMMLLLKGKTRDEAIAQVRKELQLALSLDQNIPERQRMRE